MFGFNGASQSFAGGLPSAPTEHSQRAKYFAFRRGARLRCIASGYVNRSCDEASTQKTSAPKRKANVEKP